MGFWQGDHLPLFLWRPWLKLLVASLNCGFYKCLVGTLFVWLLVERNARIFKDHFSCLLLPWDRLPFVASLWAMVQSLYKAIFWPKLPRDYLVFYCIVCTIPFLSFSSFFFSAKSLLFKKLIFNCISHLATLKCTTYTFFFQFYYISAKYFLSASCPFIT